VLVTCLFYPAILGYLFYFLLDRLTWGGFTLDSLVLIVAYIGIVTAFSIDFLYSYATREYYSARLFVADLVILVFLLLASRALVEGITENDDVWFFFVSYTAIHVVFLIWDLILLDRSLRRASIIAYDACGLIISLIGLLFFRDSVVAAIITLWACSIAYLLVGWKAIFEMVETEKR